MLERRRSPSIAPHALDGTPPAGLLLPRRGLLGLAALTTAACAAPLPRLAMAATQSFYVSPDGSDGGVGSRSSPWRTIARAMRADLRGGDEVVVLPGTYTETVLIERGGDADRGDGYVVLRAAQRGSVRVRPPSGSHITIMVRADFVIVDGLDVVGGASHAIDVENCHHVRVRRCVAHDSGGSGISCARAEHLVIEDNRVYRNAATNRAHCSGISVYQCRNLTGSGGGYRTIVRRNVTFANFQRFGGEHTDGNGIIIDDMRHTQDGRYPAYGFAALVESNVAYNNGGKGIQVVWSDNVTVRNNTCWRNNLDNNNPGTWRGELSNGQSSNNTWVNNVAVADPSVNRNNTAIGNQSYGGYVNRGTGWHHNLTFDGTPGRASLSVTAGNASPRPDDGNLLGVDPRFVDASGGSPDLRLADNSPAIGRGTSRFGVPASDVTGRRHGSTVDIGAYQHGGGSDQVAEETAKPAQGSGSGGATPEPTQTASKSGTTTQPSPAAGGGGTTTAPAGSSFGASGFEPIPELEPLPAFGAQGSSTPTAGAATIGKGTTGTGSIGTGTIGTGTTGANGPGNLFDRGAFGWR